jgi:mono/diheme cytochrome c family protein
MRLRVRIALGGSAVVLAVSLASASAGQRGPTATAAPETYRDVYNGWKWWHVYCYRCHGVDAVGTATAPSLIDPAEDFTRAEFLSIVRIGRVNTAMQGWSKLLDDRQIGQIYLYVRARADKVLPAGRPDENGAKGGPWVPPEGWPRSTRTR